MKRLHESALDEARLFLLVNFVETYLVLSERERKELHTRQQVSEETNVEATELT